MKDFKDLKAWVQWKKKEKDLSEDDVLFVKDLEDLISLVGTLTAKLENKPITKPLIEYKCTSETTHYQGCECYEQKHRLEINDWVERYAAMQRSRDHWKDEHDKLKVILDILYTEKEEWEINRDYWQEKFAKLEEVIKKIDDTNPRSFKSLRAIEELIKMVEVK